MSADVTTSTPAETVANIPVDRRRFLVGGAAAAGAALVAARYATSGSPGAPTTTAGAVAPAAAPPRVLGAPTGDLAVAAFAAGLEVLAVGTYQAALDAAVAGKLGAVPAAGADFVTKALAQHKEHQAAWNKVLTDAGETAVSAPDPGLKPVVDKEFAKVTDFAGAAKLALMLEEIAAATYLNALPALVNRDAVKLAASIQGVDAKHAAVLHFVLGEYPVPDVFAKTALAAQPSGAALPRTS